MPESEAEAKFLRDRIAHAEDIAHDLWVNTCGLPSMPKQPRHMLNVAVLAIATAHAGPSESSDLIDLAAEHIDDPRFKEFIREPDVRAGLRSLISDARSAVRSMNIPALAGIVQTALLAPLGGPADLRREIGESVRSSAARIVADTSSIALMHPRAGAASANPSVAKNEASPPQLGPTSDFLLDTQRILTGQSTSRPVSGLPKFLMGLVGFVVLAVVLNALDASCAAMLR